MESLALGAFIMWGVVVLVAIVTLAKFLSIAFDVRLMRTQVLKFIDYQYEKDRYKINKEVQQ